MSEKGIKPQLRRDVRAWVDQRIGEFQVRDLPLALRTNRKATARVVARLADFDDVLVRLRYGVYERKTDRPASMSRNGRTPLAEMGFAGLVERMKARGLVKMTASAEEAEA